MKHEEIRSDQKKKKIESCASKKILGTNWKIMKNLHEIWQQRNSIFFVDHNQTEFWVFNYMLINQMK